MFVDMKNILILFFILQIFFILSIVKIRAQLNLNTRLMKKITLLTLLFEDRFESALPCGIQRQPPEVVSDDELALLADVLLVYHHGVLRGVAVLQALEMVKSLM